MGEELQPPEYLTKDFLQQCLERGGRFPGVQIQDCVIEPAVGVGDNYSSCMFRVRLEILEEQKKRQLPIIVKCLPVSEKLLEGIRQHNFFIKEAEMLTTILPKIHKILESVGQFPVLWPDAYYEQGPPEDLIVMEDLCVSGFRGADRYQGLDVEHCNLVMRSLGEYHAASVRFLQLHPEYTQKYSGGIWEEGNDKIGLFFQNSIQELVNSVDSWSEKKYASRIEKLVERMTESVFDATRRSDDCLNVLNHGDLWTNNMMFRYNSDSSTPQDLKFVDFQLGSYNSPIMDILYFIFTSPRNDVRIQHLDTFLQTYHTHFTKTCTALQLDVDFSLEALKKEFLRRLMFGFAMSISVFPITCAPSQDAFKPDEINEQSGEGFTGANMFKNKRYIEGVLQILPYMEEHGVF